MNTNSSTGVLPEGIEAGTTQAATDAEGNPTGGDVQVNRRGFLKVMGISGVVSSVACQQLPVRQAMTYLNPPEHAVPGVNDHYATICTGCEAACGVLASVRDGRPIKLEGLPTHPDSKGGLCAVGQGQIRGLYDAGRLRAPTAKGSTVAWAELDAAVSEGLRKAQSQGRDVVVVARRTASPTTQAVLNSFSKRFNGRVVLLDSVLHGGQAERGASELLTGTSAAGNVNFEGIDYLLTLGGDMLGADPASVAATAGYASRRRLRKERDFRHIHVESSLSLTGAASDSRIMATPAERESLALHLLANVAAQRSSVLAGEVTRWLGKLHTPGSMAAQIRELSAALGKHGGRARVMSGSNVLAEQMAVNLINQLLRSAGSVAPSTAVSALSDERLLSLDAFAAGLKQKRVGAVLFLDCNPLEDSLQATAIAEGLAGVGLTVALTDRPDATSRACTYHAAAHHGLERWGDAVSSTGYLSLQQPMLTPLFDTRAPLESLLLWSGAAVTEVEPFMRSRWGMGMHSWKSALARGGVQQPTLPASDSIEGQGAEAVATAWTRDDAACQKALKPRAASTKGMQVELVADVSMRDGRHGFNPWLREMAEPLTRVAWVGAVRIAPATAGELGVADGDLVRVSVGDTTVEMPAVLMPGQHRSVLGVPVGYGMVDGDGGAGERNAYALASTAGGTFVTAGLEARIERADAVEALPLVQWEGKLHDRPILHQVRTPDEKVPSAHHGEAHSLWEGHEYETHWDMVIDLDACTGCGACVVSCQAENNLPVVGPEQIAKHRDMAWLRIDRYFTGDDENPDVLFEPMMCAQCDNAPCETVCPVAATVHGHDGLNNQAYNRCVGTRYCANNCPYKVRRFNWFDFTPKDPIERLVLNPDVVVRERGIMEKCTFCVQRIQRQRIANKQDHNRGGEHPEPVTACQQSCPAQAISFGDGAKKGAAIVERKEQPRSFRVLEEVGVDPSITYLARVRRRDESGGAK